MLKWLNYWRRAIRIPKPAVEEQPPPSPQPPITFLNPGPRVTLTQTLPYKLAVDPLESRLFYPSIDGKIVSRSLTSGAIEWQSEEFGYPLRVTDEILWAVHSDAIAAYSTTDGQRLMRSNPLWLPGQVIDSRCNLSEQTLRIDLHYVHQWMGGTPAPSHEDSAAYQISLITGEVTQIYKFEYTIASETAYDPGHNWREGDGQVYPSVSREQLLKMAFDELVRSEWNLKSKVFSQDRFEQLLKNEPKLFDELLRSQPQIQPDFIRGMRASAQLHTASVIIYSYWTDDATERTVLSVFSNQPPYSKQWEVIINEYRREPLRPLPC